MESPTVTAEKVVGFCGGLMVPGDSMTAVGVLFWSDDGAEGTVTGLGRRPVGAEGVGGEGLGDVVGGDD